MKEIEYEDTIFKVGKNSAENWELLKENEKYLWFHLESFPSCYVVCCSDEPTNDMITYGAKLCKENTKYRNFNNIKISYTPLSNLNKADKVGAVYIKSNRKVKKIGI
tara:strand:- start:561 stop:881 length:321 start_codon:yes stop_codon:yes gene_type:complete